MAYIVPSIDYVLQKYTRLRMSILSMVIYTVRVPRVRTYVSRTMDNIISGTRYYIVHARTYVPRTYTVRFCDVIGMLLLEIFYIELEGAALDQTSEHGIAAYLHVLAS